MEKESNSILPERLEDETALEEFLTRPSAALIEFIRTVSSPLVLLGAGGKMGPTLAVLARRAADVAGHPLTVIAVSRFSDAGARAWLEARGVETIACDLLERDTLKALPKTENILYLVGLKFGTRENPAATWAANTLIPARVATRYPHSRIAALSTGNVYPLVPVNRGGARENHPLTPIGEYPNAAVARERLFEFFAQRNGTRIAVLRLNYAVELRYGVLLDIAQKIWSNELINLSNGWFNCIWQGDANEMVIRSLGLAANPAAIFNLTGPAAFSVRETARRFGELMRREPRFTGQESDTALLSDPSRLVQLLGPPATPVEAMLRWVADWVMRGGRTLNRPTHFEVRDGQY